MFENSNPMLNTSLKVHKVKSGIFLRNQISGTTYNVGPMEYALLSSLDGKHTVNELKRINSKYLDGRQFEEFLFLANDNGLLESDIHTKKRFDIFKIKKGLFCPMEVLHEGKFVNVLKWIMIVLSSISLVALGFFITQRGGLVFQILFTNDYLQAVNIVYYFLSILVIGFFHELGHAIAIIASGGNVFEMGVMLNYFHPAFFVDITGVHSIKSRRSRIFVWIAGIMNQVILAAPTMILAFYEKSPWFLNEFLIIFNSINVAMSLFNLLFLIKLDGYYILSELLDIDNLREKSLSGILNGFKQKDDISASEQIIFTVIGLISMIYLPLFMMQLVITGVNRFVPSIMPIVNNCLLVSLLICCISIITRILISRIKGRKI